MFIGISLDGIDITVCVSVLLIAILFAQLRG